MQNSEGLKGIVPVESPFVVHSILGSYAFFFLPDSLSTFYGSISLDLLKQIGSSLCLKEGILRIDATSEALQYLECKDVNHTKSKEIDHHLR